MICSALLRVRLNDGPLLRGGLVPCSQLFSATLEFNSGRPGGDTRQLGHCGGRYRPTTAGHRSVVRPALDVSRHAVVRHAEADGPSLTTPPAASMPCRKRRPRSVRLLGRVLFVRATHGTPFVKGLPRGSMARKLPITSPARILPTLCFDSPLLFVFEVRDSPFSLENKFA